MESRTFIHFSLVNSGYKKLIGSANVSGQGVSHRIITPLWQAPVGFTGFYRSREGNTLPRARTQPRNFSHRP